MCWDLCAIYIFNLWWHRKKIKFVSVLMIPGLGNQDLTQDLKTVLGSCLLWGYLLIKKISKFTGLFENGIIILQIGTKVIFDELHGSQTRLHWSYYQDTWFITPKFSIVNVNIEATDGVTQITARHSQSNTDVLRFRVWLTNSHGCEYSTDQFAPVFLPPFVKSLHLLTLD